MELRFTEEQETIRQKARQFAIDEVTPVIPHMEEDGESSFPAELVKRMSALELMGIPVPEQWGGAGADFIAYIAAIHEIAKVSAAVGVILSVHTSEIGRAHV